MTHIIGSIIESKSAATSAPLCIAYIKKGQNKLDDEPTIYVDYTDVSHIRDSLEKYNVEVVISCLNVISAGASQAEVNLARACDSSAGTHRFNASQWSIKTPPGSPLPDFSAATLAVLSQTKLEYTIVFNGHFSDYYGYPKVKTYLKHADFLVDIANKAAAVPGSGEDRVAFTYSFDVARFVDDLVNTEEKCPKHSVIIGEKITVNGMVAIAEGARGKSKVINCHILSNVELLRGTILHSP
ncbi:hypothetical protein BFJ69_g6688 [Fusarium oxysporum]|uniref:NmrA-like domain-containing protein n=1 Tax=Fusarium oxysporum TaxID=5507 RepID=A0A420N8Z2_FUSOX|nr:hypothetical protein BFJ69_g6688 [Fusarium oxysporum]